MLRRTQHPAVGHGQEGCCTALPPNTASLSRMRPVCPVCLLLTALLLTALLLTAQVSMLDDKVWQVLAEMPAPEALAVIQEVGDALDNPDTQIRNINAFFIVSGGLRGMCGCMWQGGGQSHHAQVRRGRQQNCSSEGVLFAMSRQWQCLNCQSSSYVSVACTRATLIAHCQCHQHSVV